jgi:hypothetical protein
MPIRHLLIAGVLGSALTSCRPQSEWPPDIHGEVLDAPTAINSADSIVLAVPLRHRDIREWAPRSRTEPGPPKLAEVETTLKVLRVLKGPALPEEIEFRFYDGRGYRLVIGMPKGPSGPIGTSAIFFLRQRPDGTFRSLVDIYRPDLETPWLIPPIGPNSCRSPQECVVEALLGYRGSNNWQAFGTRLARNVGIGQRLAFLTTLDLLRRLAVNQEAPIALRQETCGVLSEAFLLESPPVCTEIGDQLRVKDSSRRISEWRERLREGGLTWVQQHIGSDHTAQVKHYLLLLTKSSDRETRAVAAGLLETLP